QSVYVAVLEVGLGGRYDATSVVDPIASAITSVTLEHTDMLGDTVGEIGRDMATVVPRDNSIVTAATGDAREAIEESAGDALTVGPDGDVSVTHEGRTGVENAVRLSGQDWTVETRLSLLGAHQAENAGIAAALARQITTEFD